MLRDFSLETHYQATTLHFNHQSVHNMIPRLSTRRAWSVAEALNQNAICSRAYTKASDIKPLIAPLPRRGVLELAGPDAQKFLKGLTSRDVEHLGGGYSGFLNATVSAYHLIPPTRSPSPSRKVTVLASC